MELDEAMKIAAECDKDDELILSNKQALKVLRDAVARFPERVVAALENATVALSEETHGYRAGVAGKPITGRDVAAICAGAARYASLVEEELGLLDKGASRSIRVVLSTVKLKMGIPVT